MNKSGSNLVEVENTEIPPGDEHHRCREALFNEGACVKIPDQYGWTPLMLAVTENHVQCLNALIKAGADVNMKDIKGDTALNVAACLGREACLKLLIEAGADVNIPNDYRTAPLLSSIEDQFDVFFVNKLIDGQYEMCEVGASAIGGQWENLPDMLIKAGANVNQGDRIGYTPLMAAVGWKLIGVINMLLTAGADVNIKDFQDKDALYLASYGNNYKAIELLCKAGADVNNCNEARDGHTEFVKALLAGGADVNLKDKHGKDALYWAAYRSNFDLIQILLPAGADVNSRDEVGESPLLVAVCIRCLSLDHKLEQPERVKCVNLLIKAGADVNAQTSYGETPLTYAGLQGYVKCMKLLIEAGADVNHSAIKDGVPTRNAVSDGEH